MLRFTTIILSLTFLAQWSEADEDVKVDELEYLLITASRINEKAFEAPYNLHSVEETELVLRSVRSVPEVFSYTPGVVVQKTAHGQGSRLAVHSRLHSLQQPLSHRWNSFK